eukprot:CAMPEP_0203682026 /NCGR_PEP_ID=MMETSP0090-20130426/44475_1 /ASSEMBLY_ACC=CAM_ASM_001088 /TAXON_ID=426623 /ORGANISM="Chaetoceros affinis, Strain CCMP159" /LENGTH=233 /DNA_ID=CAMNT_0050550765 /DNA_START=318 /DNA_END=1015 /DNA_ORIENTATION=-
MDSDNLQYTLDDQGVCKDDTIITAGGRACRCVPGTPRSETLDFSLSWDSPYLPKFDPVQSCFLLGQRKLAIIGDSTANQASAVLTDALYPGGCSGNVRWLLSDTLIDKELGNLNRGNHWMAQVEENGYPDIVILSVGAHIHTEENYTQTIDEVVEGIQQLHKDHPEVQVVWKTQSPAGCTDDATHSHPLDAGLEFNFDINENNRFPYWRNFYPRDQYTIEKMMQLGVPILDVR